MASCVGTTRKVEALAHIGALRGQNEASAERGRMASTGSSMAGVIALSLVELTAQGGFGNGPSDRTGIHARRDEGDLDALFPARRELRPRRHQQPGYGVAPAESQSARKFRRIAEGAVRPFDFGRPGELPGGRRDQIDLAAAPAGEEKRNATVKPLGLADP